MKILFINAVCGVGSTGRIVTDLARQAKSKGHTVKVACSTIEPIKGVRPDEVITVGSRQDYYLHNLLSRLTDHEGLFSRSVTRKLLSQIKEYDPDLVHLHNLHGHWINYELLFRYLAEEKKKVVWTLHDCWAFTGHCSHFSLLKCEQWKSRCLHCNGLHGYPMCYGKGDVANNFDRKKKAFTSVGDMTIVTPSEWLASLVRESFLGKYPVEVVHNKIDMSVFTPTASDFRKAHHAEGKTIVLGVANVWNQSKGLDDFLKLRELLDERYVMVMVGLTQEQMAGIPGNIIGIQRTNSARELAEIYTAADVFVNLTYQDNYPTVNLEAIACGTPVVSYMTGGSCEAFDKHSGVAVRQGAVGEVPGTIERALLLDEEEILQRAKAFYSYGDYLSLIS